MGGGGGGGEEEEEVSIKNTYSQFNHKVSNEITRNYTMYTKITPEHICLIFVV